MNFTSAMPDAKSMNRFSLLTPTTESIDGSLSMPMLLTVRFSAGGKGKLRSKLGQNKVRGMVP